MTSGRQLAHCFLHLSSRDSFTKLAVFCGGDESELVCTRRAQFQSQETRPVGDRDSTWLLSVPSFRPPWIHHMLATGTREKCCPQHSKFAHKNTSVGSSTSAKLSCWNQVLIGSIFLPFLLLHNFLFLYSFNSSPLLSFLASNLPKRTFVLKIHF